MLSWCSAEGQWQLSQASRDGRRVLGVPLAPDAVGTDVEELELGAAVVARAQRPEKRGVFFEIDRVGVVGFETRDAGATDEQARARALQTLALVLIVMAIVLLLLGRG